MSRRGRVAAPLLLMIAAWQIAAAGKLPNGVSPDCTEKPVTVEELDKLARSDKVTSMQDFLDSIPKDSMQTFTFVANSLSLQRGGENGGNKVNPLWPRVIRSTADSKLTISFVCDPDNPAFGAVEAIYFDEKENRLKTKEWKFTDGGKPVPSASRVHDSPESCVKCHSSRKEDPKLSTDALNRTIKYNWPEYFFWSDCQRDRGISLYGSDDDVMDLVNPRGRQALSVSHAPKGCNGAKDYAAHSQELKDYQAFREKQKDNPCFNSLPWPKVSEKEAKDPKVLAYPYSYGDRDYFPLRPNLRLTANFARWTARRNAQLLKNAGPYYDLMKYYVAMEAAGCLIPGDEAAIKQKVGGGFTIDRSDPVPVNFFDASTPQNLPILYSFAKSVGFKAADWNLELEPGKDPSYNAGLPRRIDNFVAGIVLGDIAKDNPAVRAAVGGSIVRYTTNGRGSKYACMEGDDGMLGAQGAYKNYGTMAKGPNTPLCKALRAENNKQQPDALAQFQKAGGLACFKDRANLEPAESLVKATADSIEVLGIGSAERGKELVKADSKGKCVSCHSAGSDRQLPAELRFVANDKDSPKQKAESLAVLKARMKEGTFIKTLRARVQPGGSMPPGGSTLTRQDSEDIEAYLESLANQ